jgi:hypothetical protein
MGSLKEGPRGRVIVYAAIGIGAFAIIVIILFSGFSLGQLTGTVSNPFGLGEGPPKILLIKDGVKYEGRLYGYTFSQRFESFQELPDINTGNITAISTDNIVSINHGSQIQYAIEGNPPNESQFDSLSVTAYTEDGTPVAILDVLSNNSTENQVHSFSVNKLESGRQYILLSTATWLDYQDSPTIAGYVYYGHRISVQA